MASIEWRHNRRSLRVLAAFMPGYASQNATAMARAEVLLDTGATGTGIHPSIVEQLGLRRKGQRRVDTANGMILAPEYVVRIGFVCGDYADPARNIFATQPYMIEREIVAFGLLPGFPHSALIGMDILGHGDLSITRDGAARFSFD